MLQLLVSLLLQYLSYIQSSHTPAGPTGKGQAEFGTRMASIDYFGMIVARLKQEQLQSQQAANEAASQRSSPCARIHEMVREFSSSGFAKVLVPGSDDDSLAPLALDVREFVERAGAAASASASASASAGADDLHAADEFRTFLLQRVLYGYLSATRSANFLDQCSKHHYLVLWYRECQQQQQRLLSERSQLEERVSALEAEEQQPDTLKRGLGMLTMSVQREEELESSRAALARLSTRIALLDASKHSIFTLARNELRLATASNASSLLEDSDEYHLVCESPIDDADALIIIRYLTTLRKFFKSFDPYLNQVCLFLL